MNGSALTSSVFTPKTVQASTAHSPAEHSTPVTRLNFVNVDESPPKAPRRTSALLPAIKDGMLDYVGFPPIVCVSIVASIGILSIIVISRLPAK